MVRRIETERLVIRPWRDEDAADALAIYGRPEVGHWLSPALRPVTNVVAMRSLLHEWQTACRTRPPAGHWAVEHHDTRWLVGGLALLPLLPGGQDLSIAWQLAPEAWGRGFATEAATALLRRVFDEGQIDEVLAVLRPRNSRAVATARRIGMEWVGETDKYYGLHLQVYRVRHADVVAAGRGSMAAEDPLPY